jgi:hypothetical protein
MKWFVVLGAVLLTACSENHSFVVDTAGADKPVATAVVTICKEPPKALQPSGKLFVGRVVSRCGEGEGRVRLTYADGTTTDCPIGYVTSFDDWWLMKVRGRSCTVEWKSEQ